MSTTMTTTESSTGAQHKAANGRDIPTTRKAQATGKRVRRTKAQIAAGQAPTTKAAKQPTAHAAIPASQQQRQQGNAAQFSSGLMFHLIQALPPPGTKMTQEKAIVWLKAAEANLTFLYDLPGIPIQIAA